MLSPGVQRWPAPAANRARACSAVSASTHHSSTRVTSILAWNSRGFVSGAVCGAVLGARNNALLVGMVVASESADRAILDAQRKRTKKKHAKPGSLVEREFPKYSYVNAR